MPIGARARSRCPVSPRPRPRSPNRPAACRARCCTACTACCWIPIDARCGNSSAPVTICWREGRPLRRRLREPPAPCPAIARVVKRQPQAIGKVLVLGDDTMSFLAIVRALGRRGLTVDVVAEDLQSPALASRYINQRRDLPRYVGTGRDWEAATAALLEAEFYDLVLP